MTVSITTRDLENLLNLLCREEENMLPVKEIPESMSPEHQKVGNYYFFVSDTVLVDIQRGAYFSK